MKEITAYIRPNKLQDLTLALHLVEGLTGMSVVDIRGFGRTGQKGETRTQAEELMDLVPHVKIEIVCLDRLVEEVVSVIEKAAHTGLRGDGKIYVSSIDTAVRIETGERGESAI